MRHAPSIDHFHLANGLEVVVIPDRRAPVVTHMVYYRNGAADDPLGKSGIAHFLEHLMFKGTDKHPKGEFSEVVAGLGGQENAFTSYDYTAYYQRVAREHLGAMMALEADRMTGLVLDGPEVLSERDVVIEERKMRTDSDPAARLQESMLATLYVHHPYGTPVIGWGHEIEGLSREDALAYYRPLYRPDNAMLIVAGDVDCSAFKDTLVKQKATALYKRKKFGKELLSELSIGARADYLFGSILHTSSVIYPRATYYYNTRRYRAVSFNDVTGSFGLQTSFTIDSLKHRELRKKVKVAFGYFMNLGNTINVKNSTLAYNYSINDFGNEAAKDTFIYVIDNPNTIRLPMEQGVGVSLRKVDMIAVAAEAAYTNWSQFRYLGSATELKNSFRVAAGINFIPNKNSAGASAYLKRIQYRLGGFYKTGSLELNNTVYEALNAGKRLLAEGAQGSMLDLDFGTYPYVTSSNTISSGICNGLGVAPKHIGKVIGIAKAYCTRVGSGPFPTELHGVEGDNLRQAGAEFGSTTGRPRRCGWIDLPQLKYSIMLNGVDTIALTKIDVLDHFTHIKAATAYQLRDGQQTTQVPFSLEEDVDPILTTLEGWHTDISACRKKSDLPQSLLNYLKPG